MAVSAHLIIALSLLISSCYCAKSPCPDIVQFKKINNKPVTEITVKNDYSGIYNLDVEATYPFRHEKRDTTLTIVNREDIRIKDVPKFIYFMKTGNINVFPKVTKVVYNGVTICSGPPHDADIVTTIQVSRYLKAPIQQQFANKVRKSRQSDDLTLISGYQCGSVGENNIGFPWLGVLFAYKVEAKNYEYICTVTLISDKHAITAANCVQKQNTLNFDVDDLIAVFGKPVMDNWVQNSILANVEKITVHPQLVKNKAGPDLAILTLTQSIFSSKRVQPICLEGKNDDSAGENSGIVSGWGITAQNQIHKTTPFKMDMEQLDATKCKELEENLANYTYCAGTKENKSSCMRNLGIPYIVEKNDTYYLKGVVAHTSGKPCGNVTIFTDITKEYGWIDSVLTSV